MIARLASEETSQGRRIGPLYGWFDFDSLPAMQEARRERIDSAVKLFHLGVPMNTVNALLDLGLPPLPHGARSYLPSNLTPIP